MTHSHTTGPPPWCPQAKLQAATCRQVTVVRAAGPSERFYEHISLRDLETSYLKEGLWQADGRRMQVSHVSRSNATSALLACKQSNQQWQVVYCESLCRAPANAHGCKSDLHEWCTRNAPKIHEKRNLEIPCGSSDLNQQNTLLSNPKGGHHRLGVSPSGPCTYITHPAPATEAAISRMQPPFWGPLLPLSGAPAAGREDACKNVCCSRA